MVSPPSRGLSPVSPSLLDFSPSLSPSLSLFWFPFVAGGLILHFSLNSVLLGVVDVFSCVWPCSPKHFLNLPTVWGLRWCNFLLWFQCLVLSLFSFVWFAFLIFLWVKLCQNMSKLDRHPIKWNGLKTVLHLEITDSLGLSYWPNEAQQFFRTWSSLVHAPQMQNFHLQDEQFVQIRKHIDPFYQVVEDPWGPLGNHGHLVLGDLGDWCLVDVYVGWVHESSISRLWVIPTS